MSVETAPAPAATAPAPAVAPAAAEAAPITPAAPAATAPAAPAAVEASPQRPGFLSRLLSGGHSDDGVIAALRADLAAEQAAHGATRDLLTAAQGQVTGYQEMEARLETLLTSEQRAAVGSSTPAATVNAAVSNGVRDVIAGMGIEPAKLPAAQETIPGAKGDAGEFAHLKGRDRAAAAFSAQMEKLKVA